MATHLPIHLLILSNPRKGGVALRLPYAVVVRPSRLSFEGEETLPQWTATLARQLADGGASAPPEILTPVPLLEELLATSDGIRRGHVPTDSDRQSLGEDLILACKSLGPKTIALHAAELKALRKQAGQLGKTTDFTQTCALASGLLSGLASCDSRAAAFDDCVAAFRDLQSADVCEVRLQHLRSFVVLAEHDWGERVRLVRDALADRVSAQTAAGAEPPDDPSACIRPAGMTLDERLALGKDFLRDEPNRGDVIVWLAYGNASLDRAYLKKGPLEFYDSRIWSAALGGHWPGNPDWSQPFELAAPDAAAHLDGLPERDFVMVRVWLSAVGVNEAERRARALANAALALTGWESEWIPLRGAPMYITQWFGSVGFGDQRFTAPESSALRDPVTFALRMVDEQLLLRSSASEQALIELLDDIRWRRDTRQISAADYRVTLITGLIERTLPPKPGKRRNWFDDSKYFLRTLVALDDLSDRVHDAGLYAVWGSPSNRRGALSFVDEIVTYGDGSSFVVNKKGVLARIDDLIALVDPETIEGRVLADIKQRTSNGPAAAAWFKECQERFDRLLSRARRQRNSILHGTRTVPEVVSSIEPFLDHVAGRIVGALQRSVEERTSLETQLARYKTIWDKRMTILAEGGDPATELFPIS